MPPNQREVQRRLMKKYHIFFDGPIDSIEYRESITADSSRSPWRHQAQRRAKRIAEKAKLCIEGRRNESGWRLSLESDVMARFTVEIACRKCRGRLWRSEQEVIPNQSGGNGVNSLKARQRRRRPCNCYPNGLNQDIPEQGISPLFDDRAEEAIMYSPQLQSELPKREERPDRVYGLQATNRLSRLLQSAKDIRSSPFRPDGEPIIFPFLVIEAKSEKGSDAFTDTQVQTAFAIRELLLIQRGLAQAAGEDTEWDAGPLVWFLSYKGEQWRVSAAYTHNQDDVTFYVIWKRVMRIWAGNVDSLDNALQLLLIIDYIADWARDIYREGIACSLQKLAASDSNSMARDDDIFSLAGNVREWVSSNPKTKGAEANQIIEDPLRAFDCPEGVFRDARFIRSRFIGLIITEENLDQFLRTAQSNDEARGLAARLLQSIEDACRVKGHLLDELELIWTDTDRNLSEMSRSDEVFLVVVTSFFYLTENWEQARELSYVAVSESLIHDLAKIARVPLPSTQVPERAPMVASLAAFGDLLNREAKDNLTACISQLFLYTGSAFRGNHLPLVWKTLPTAAADNSSKPKQDMAIIIGSQAHTWAFLYTLYSQHRVGRNEPATSIFRISSTSDELAEPAEFLKRQDLLSKDPWPWRDWGSPVQNEEAHGLVFALRDTIHTSDTPGLCIFVLDPSAAEIDPEILSLVAGQFDFSSNRLFIRRAYQSSLKATLLGIETSTLTIQRDALVTTNGDGQTRNLVASKKPKTVRPD
ncbi:hypothetical protein FSARC_3557 [Fusarium sarcochroum]|uniref:Uncharacterized protein n=1 Tax=Fusarium sarcochroum TaxID=1208366 RepID=A0A8H4XCH9_9HYPO|nr:hypothetical protein FSARC_3557 [Fusarium sarcochroum]